MDIKGKINEIVKKIKSDKNFATKFSSDPVNAVKSVIGINIPDDQVKSIIDGIKAKVDLDKASGLLGKVKGIFK